LDEGPTMLSHIIVDGSDIAIGDQLIFTPTVIGGAILPCFRKETT